MAVYERPDPYDQWERFKLPLYKRLLILLFLDKRERSHISKRVDRINQQRKVDRHKAIKVQREYGLRKMREYRKGVKNGSE